MSRLQMSTSWDRKRPTLHVTDVPAYNVGVPLLAPQLRTGFGTWTANGPQTHPITGVSP